MRAMVKNSKYEARNTKQARITKCSNVLTDIRHTTDERRNQTLINAD
jgi:hypothetical protein